jgi:hypothetical protein
MLDEDLAGLYGVGTRALAQAVKRNAARFPDDFMFRLTQEEFDGLRSPFVTSTPERRGGRRYLPYAFTEQGVALLSSVLRSERHPRQHRNQARLRAFTADARVECRTGPETGSARKEVRCRVQGGIRRHPCVDDRTGIEEETAYWLCALGRHMKTRCLVAIPREPPNG